MGLLLKQMKAENYVFGTLAIVASILRWIAIMTLYNLIRLDFMPILTFWQMFGFVSLYSMINPRMLIREDYKETWQRTASISFIMYLIVNIILAIIIYS